MRVQGVSPFLFTFRLVAFNYASYLSLLVPYGPAWTCSAWVLVPATFRKPPPFEFTVNLTWFVSVAEPTLPGPQLAVRRLHLGEGLSSVSYTVSDPPAPSILGHAFFERTHRENINTLWKVICTIHYYRNA